jgi:hypothetical protein
MEESRCASTTTWVGRWWRAIATRSVQPHGRVGHLASLCRTARERGPVRRRRGCVADARHRANAPVAWSSVKQRRGGAGSAIAKPVTRPQGIALTGLCRQSSVSEKATTALLIAQCREFGRRHDISKGIAKPRLGDIKRLRRHGTHAEDRPPWLALVGERLKRYGRH